ncbi:hypothetical protein F4825DRAFT_451227 [Nemania diffusa]|nr:hypothetical protein F4825DRAFT_451227 [Nemania diffusa]
MSKRSHAAASACDEDILSSGKFSDVTVKCGERTWELHRVILTSRCGFFRAALEDGRYKEAKENLVEIHEQDPAHINWVIHFIYTAKAPDDLLELLQNKKTVLGTCVDLFTAADFFNLDILCKRAADVMIEHLISQARDIQKHLRQAFKEKDNDWKALQTQETREFLGDFFSVAKRVYGMGSSSFGPLKTALLLFLKLTRCTILRPDLSGDVLFRERGLKDFAVDIFRITLSPNQMAGEIGEMRSCSYCGAERGLMMDFGKAHYMTPSPRCRECAKPVGDRNVLHKLGVPRSPKRQCAVPELIGAVGRRHGARYIIYKAEDDTETQYADLDN